MSTSTTLNPPQPAEPKTQPDAPASTPPDAPDAAAGRKRRLVRIGAVVVLVVVGVIVWRVFFSTPALPDSVVAVSGRIEGDDSAVASKTNGRILEVRVREGDTVNAGDVIAVLDDAQIRAREDQARAALSAAEAKGAAARAQITVLQQQLMQSRLQVGQSKLDTQGHVRQAEAELAAAQSDLAQQQASYSIAAFDKDAYTRLAKSGAVSERQGLQAAATADQQAAAVAAAKRRVEAAQAALTTAQGTLSNPDIHESQVNGMRDQITQQQAEVASAAAETQQAQAQLAEAQDNRNDLTIRAPFAGTVVTRAAEPGEMMTAGTAIVTLLDLTKVYLRGFIPEGQIGDVKVGQAAHIYLDSAPHTPVDAYVSRIDPQATFTPENTYFQNDRVKQVVGIKLQLKAGFGAAKPGMPADGDVLVKGDAWPKVSH
jgi:HlyD family secretion protein